MARTEIKWAGVQAFYDIRRLPSLIAVLESSAERVADAANGMAGLGDGGYMTGSRQGAKKPQGRWHSSVVTATAAAMHDNAKNNTIIKSMDAGRI